MDWTEFAFALGLFTASHFVPRLGDLRGRLIARVGRRAYFSVYGVLSLALLVWVVSAAGRAPYVELWPQTPWTRWVPNVVLPASLVLAAIGMGVNSPFTLGGQTQGCLRPLGSGADSALAPSAVSGAGALGGGASVSEWRSGLCDRFRDFHGAASSGNPRFRCPRTSHLGRFRARVLCCDPYIVAPAPYRYGMAA